MWLKVIPTKGRNATKVGSSLHCGVAIVSGLRTQRICCSLYPFVHLWEPHHSGYSEWQILQAHKPLTRAPPQCGEESTSVAFLLFVGMTLNRISRVLPKHNVKMVGLQPRKLSSFLRSIKDDVALKMPGVWSIPCECGKVCVGQTGRSIETRVTEHHQLMYVYRLKNCSGITQHQPGSSDAATECQYSGQEDETDELNLKGSHKDQSPSWQHEQGRWLLPESGMENSHSWLERKETISHKDSNPFHWPWKGLESCPTLP
jgi:hypothetical protein